MAGTAEKIKSSKASLEQKRAGLKVKFGQPDYILEQMAQFLKDGDVASITDLIGAYIANSPKYKNQEEFAVAIGTTRQTLHRMLSHSEVVGVGVFFSAIERIHSDLKR